MYTERIMQLLARKIAGEATAMELAELHDLLEKQPDAIYYEEVLQQFLGQKQIDNDDTGSIYEAHKLKYASDFTIADDEVHVRWIARIRPYMVAATILIMVGVAFAYYYTGKTTNIPNTNTATMEIFAGKGVRKKVILPDGTQVWLNSNSELSYDNDMNKRATRVVNLAGEAFFDVTKNKLRPFIIHTNRFSIKVLGTAFNVKAYPEEKKSEAALIRGIIELTVNKAPLQKIILKPNEKLAIADDQLGYNKQTGIPENTKLAIESIQHVEITGKQYIEETSWVEDKLVFNNESFEELTPRLERWFNVKIQIDDDVIKNYHYTGVFQNETIQQALKAMQLIRPFKFKTNKDEININ